MDEPRIRFARTSDGVNIAYAVVGSGPPLFIVRGMLSLGVDDTLVDMPSWHWGSLVARRSLVVWDGRSLGLSEPASPRTLGSSLLDMHAVADALALPRFDIFSHGTPCHIAIAYAARHPEHLGRMILRNPQPAVSSPRTFVSGDVPDIGRDHFRDYMDLIALRTFGWERAAIAQRFAARMCAAFTFETWQELMESYAAMDATPLLSSVRARTLVIIDASVPDPVALDPQRQQFMRRLAASMPGAELSLVKPGDPRAYVPLVDAFLEVDNGDRAVDAALPDGTAIILFTDIVDSTALTERLGDTAFRERSAALDAAMRRAIIDARGTAVDGKLLGDGVMAVFGAAREAIDAALRCNVAAADAGLELHLGIHAGDVIRDGGNVYGGAVNIASRIASASAPGEILVSDIVRGLARTSAGVAFEDRGEHALKGIAEPQRLYAVRLAVA